ncbi:sulfurtransferase-like selenium metabolism protein YedF [Cohnella sp. JJ-181]|uniref:sulfurtransferase-like selenium metabolism protein YedF n=1 Tax=Cohnella rhizoplanae TaxID=2974897 RepID=UPI0022FFA8EC|nr:sulfurtransferase-like selenium metabolism protein YedF [Cohnella sp. JJ-181]CAI6024100.1 Putative sulfur carrier protein YedF [Cohnella sp. JJ-181]
MSADYTLDIRGESCPYPVIYTLETLKDMSRGQLLQVIVDCPAAYRNVPEEVVKHGYELAREPEKNGRDMIFLIKA